MRFVKPRKPRGYKLNGERSMDMCTGCIAFCCDPMAMSPAFQAKKEKRRRLGVCVACGHKPCRCKSKDGLKTSFMVTHNNRKGR